MLINFAQEVINFILSQFTDKPLASGFSNINDIENNLYYVRLENNQNKKELL